MPPPSREVDRTGRWRGWLRRRRFVIVVSPVGSCLRVFRKYAAATTGACIMNEESTSGQTANSDEAGRTPTWLDLYDWRARVARMYRERNTALREGEVAGTVLNRFRRQKNELFKSHP